MISTRNQHKFYNVASNKVEAERVRTSLVKSHKRKIILVAVLILFLFIIVGIFYFLRLRSNNGMHALSKQQTTDLIIKVGKHIDLPESESPVIATVADVAQLRNQPFFANAQNGDQLLIYAKNSLAILYDPRQDRIVKVGPVSNANAQQNIKQQSNLPIKVAFYNGTAIDHYAQTVSTQLQKQFPNIQVTKLDNASEDYKKTIVVNVTGIDKQIVDKIAKALSADIGSYPNSEKLPANADIQIILGSAE